MSLLLLFRGEGESGPVALCLWNKIDEYLQAQITATLGPDGAYTTLTLDTVAIGHTLDIDHITTPYCLISGKEIRYDSEGTHGEDEVHFDNIQYPYDIYVLTFEVDAPTAIRNAKELLRRVREFVRADLWLEGLIDEDGEIVNRVEIGNPSMSVQGLGGQNRGTYAGWAVMPLTIISEV